MRIGLITTLNTNIGDDFIRQGIMHVLNSIFHEESIEYVPINKHKAESIYPNWHPYHCLNKVHRLPKGKKYASRAIKCIALPVGNSKFDNCDLIIQCGAPVLWENCGLTTEWADTLWHEVIGRLHKRIPVLNLAAGSCYAWERKPSTITISSDMAYVKAIGSYCRLTTSRDHLAQSLFASAGVLSDFIPCSAFLAPTLVADLADDDAPLLINYMIGGGHFDWNQNIDASAWHLAINRVIQSLQKRHNLIMLCHDEKEFAIAGNIAPHIPRLWPKTPEEYFQQVSKAKAAICNRMHASVALAGLGIPSVAVCTDTRLLMVREFGLPSFYVKDVQAEQLEGQLEGLLVKRRSERERLINLKTLVRNQYIDSIIKSL